MRLGCAMGDVVSGVGGSVTDRIIDCVIVTDAIEPMMRLRQTRRPIVTTGDVPVPPALLSSFADNGGRRKTRRSWGVARQWQVRRLLTKVLAKFMSYDLQTSRLQT